MPDVYGNYCGNQNNQITFTRGTDTVAPGIRNNPAPVDKLDRACYKHDYAYSGNNAINLNNEDSYRRLENDFSLYRRGLEDAWHHPLKLRGLGIATFGMALIIFYSGPMYLLSFPVSWLEAML